MMIDKPPPSANESQRAPRPDRRSGDEQAIDDELTEALKGTFPGSDPVALESPLVSRSRKSKRS